MKRLLLPLLLLITVWGHAELTELNPYTPPAPVKGINAMAFDSSLFLYFVDSGTYASSGGSNTITTTIDLATINPGSGVAPTSATPLIYFSSDGITGIAPTLNTALIDHTGGFAYFSVGVSSASVLKVPIGLAVVTSSLTYNSSLGLFSCGFIDSANGFAYYGTKTNPAQIVKINLVDLSLVSSVTLTAPYANFESAVIDPIDHYGYFGSSAATGGAVKIDLNTFTIVGTLPFNGGEGAAVSAFLDHTVGSLWFGTNNSPGRVVRINLTTFTRPTSASSLTLDSGEDQLISVVYDSALRKAYFGTFTSTGIIVQVDPVAMHEDAHLTLRSGEAFLHAAAFDAVNRYAYFGTFTDSSTIVVIDVQGGLPLITSVAPPDEEVAVGQTASFSVTAVGRDLTYQWKRDGIAITSATQASYQLADTKLTDDGAGFNCTVSNSSGSVDSGITVLTVDPDVHVYPNPWRADRHSGVPLNFNGLPPGSVVKIFTLGAQFVRSLPENAGIAPWDLKNDSGQNAASGYYFYYVQTRNDKQQLRGKFAIIR